MAHGGGLVATAFPAVSLGGPALLALAGLLLGRRPGRTASERDDAPATGWPMILESTLLYTLAFTISAAAAARHSLLLIGAGLRRPARWCA